MSRARTKPRELSDGERGEHFAAEAERRAHQLGVMGLQMENFLQIEGPGRDEINAAADALARARRACYRWLDARAIAS